MQYVGFMEPCVQRIAVRNRWGERAAFVSTVTDAGARQYVD